MKVKNIVLTALMAAVVCALSPWAIPFGAVPLSLATLGVYVAVGLVGVRRGSAAVSIYLLLGALGVPLFAGFSGGLVHLVGPTGGYLLGYLPCALVAGGLMAWQPRRGLVPLWLAAGTLTLYAVGTLWYLWQTACPLGSALAACVLPFLVTDAAKIAVATIVIWSLRGRLRPLLYPRDAT